MDNERKHGRDKSHDKSCFRVEYTSIYFSLTRLDKSGNIVYKV